MVKIDDSILITIKKFSKNLNKKYRINNIYLYGSYSDGSYDQWSDIDLAVVVDEESSHSREIFSKGKEYDIRFDALGFIKKDFDNSLLPIIPEIKKKGIKIT